MLKEFFAYFAVILIGLSSVFLGVDFLSKVGGASPYPVDVHLLLYVYKIPSALQSFVPVACLLSSLLIITNMSRQNEILALFSSGVGSLRILSTFIATIAVVSTVSFVLFDSLVPVFVRRQVLIENSVNQKADEAPSFDVNGRWYRNGKRIYRVGRFDPSHKKIYELKAYLLSPSFRLTEAVYAKNAEFTGEDWTLFHGVINRYPEFLKFPSSEKFETLTGLIPDKPSELKSFRLAEDTMRLKDLRRFINRNSEFGVDTTGQRVRYQERIAMVFSPLVFILIGIPFALKPLRTHSMSVSMAFCFGVVFVYLLLCRLSVSIGRGGFISPFLAAWTPNLLFLSLAFFRIFRRGV